MPINQYEALDNKEEAAIDMINYRLFQRKKDHDEL